MKTAYWLVGIIVLAVVGIGIYLLAQPTPQATTTTTTSGSSQNSPGLLGALGDIGALGIGMGWWGEND